MNELLAKFRSDMRADVLTKKWRLHLTRFVSLVLGYLAIETLLRADNGRTVSVFLKGVLFAVVVSLLSYVSENTGKRTRYAMLVITGAVFLIVLINL